jgi:hypothetical protein
MTWVGLQLVVIDVVGYEIPDLGGHAILRVLY